MSRPVKHRALLAFFELLAFFVLLLPAAEAAPLTLRHKHFLFTLNPDALSSWKTEQEIWIYDGHKIAPRAEWRADGDEPPVLPEGVQKTTVRLWDEDAIKKTVEEVITSPLEREPGTVTISRNEKGTIVFDGVGFPGRKMDTEKTVDLILAAMEMGIADIELPVEEQPPALTVLDEELQKRGIQELVTIGESDFNGSPANRKHNIAVGLKRFNGALIPQGETFSFNKTLGSVNEERGYLKELVILGDKTLPDFGGGLCQVSTTAYRGIWEAGFPIENRRNHSFAVRYYSPVGTDATIYPPHTDLRFTNDSPADLLIQTHTEKGKAYFLYYGTRDGRTTEVLGPVVWDIREPPDPKTEFTAEIPWGETRKVGEAVKGMRTAWWRIVNPESESQRVERVLSVYEARPLFHQIGRGTGSTIPDWLGTDPNS